MLFELEPLVGVGPLRLGMSNDETFDALSTIGKPLWMCMGGSWSVSRPDGLNLSAKFWDGVLDSIRFYHPLGSDQVRFLGIDVFARPYESVLEAVRRHTSLVELRAGWWEGAAVGLDLGFEDEVDDDVFEVVSISRPDPD
jgi:hypothetical protein